jgi:cytoskeletal protein RodZ
VAGIAGGLTKWSTLGGPLLAGLLFVPTLGMAAAPFNSWAARRAALPAYLRQRRETEYRRDHRSFAAGVSTGGAIVVGLIAAAAIALMLTGRLIHAPSLVQPIQPPAATATTPAQTPTATQSSTPTATPSSTTPTPTPSSTPTATPTTATPTATSPTTTPASPSAPATP